MRMFKEKKFSDTEINTYYEKQLARIEKNHQIQEVKEKNIVDYFSQGIDCYNKKLFSEPEYVFLVICTLGLPVIASYTAGPISGAFDWATRKEITQEQYFYCIQRLALIDTKFKRKLFMDTVIHEYKKRYSCQPKSNSSLWLMKIMGHFQPFWMEKMNIDEKWEELLNYMIDNVNTNNGKALFNIIYELADTFFVRNFRYWAFRRFLSSDQAASIGDASMLIAAKLIELQMEAMPGFKSSCSDTDTINSLQNL